VLLALTAAWARVTILPQVFLGGRVLPRYPDALYHLRQIERASESFPRVPVLDPGLNWPLGGFSVWAPGFDWLGALERKRGQSAARGAGGGLPAHRARRGRRARRRGPNSGQRDDTLVISSRLP
jgi:hypothetical protein